MAERVWTVADALAWTADCFERNRIEQPRLSAEWLLSAVTALSRVELYAYHDRPLSEDERASYRELVAKRAEGMPLQYVTGEVAFRHLVLHVRPGVFIPRPETELLVDEALRFLEARYGEPAPETGRGPVVIDCCTGSGAVALSVAQERPDAVVYATESSPAAAEVARGNARSTGLAERVTILEGSLLEPLPADLLGRADAILANPPYIPTADLHALPAGVAVFEPSSALDGGPDGLDIARRILAEAPKWLTPGGLLAVELDTSRVGHAAALFEGSLSEVRVLPDLTGRDRMVLGSKKEEER